MVPIRQHEQRGGVPCVEGLMGEGATGETAARLMSGFATDNLNSDTTYSHIPWCE